MAKPRKFSARLESGFAFMIQKRKHDRCRVFMSLDQLAAAVQDAKAGSRSSLRRWIDAESKRPGAWLFGKSPHASYDWVAHRRAEPQLFNAIASLDYGTTTDHSSRTSIRLVHVVWALFLLLRAFGDAKHRLVRLVKQVALMLDTSWTADDYDCLFEEWLAAFRAPAAAESGGSSQLNPGNGGNASNTGAEPCLSGAVLGNGNSAIISSMPAVGFNLPEADKRPLRSWSGLGQPKLCEIEKSAAYQSIRVKSSTDIQFGGSKRLVGKMASTTFDEKVRAALSVYLAFCHYDVGVRWKDCLSLEVLHSGRLLVEFFKHLLAWRQVQWADETIRDYFVSVARLVGLHKDEDRSRDEIRLALHAEINSARQQCVENIFAKPKKAADSPLSDPQSVKAIYLRAKELVEVSIAAAIRALDALPQLDELPKAADASMPLSPNEIALIESGLLPKLIEAAVASEQAILLSLTLPVITPPSRIDALLNLSIPGSACLVCHSPDCAGNVLRAVPNADGFELSFVHYKTDRAAFGAWNVPIKDAGLLRIIHFMLRIGRSVLFYHFKAAGSSGFITWKGTSPAPKSFARIWRKDVLSKDPVFAKLNPKAMRKVFMTVAMIDLADASKSEAEVLQFKTAAAAAMATSVRMLDSTYVQCKAFLKRKLVESAVDAAAGLAKRVKR